MGADGTGWLVDDSGLLYLTSDSGQTWTATASPVAPEAVVATADALLVADLVEVPGEDLVTTYQLATAISADGGATWATSTIEMNGQPGHLEVAVNGSQAAVLVQQTTGTNFSVADVIVSMDGLNWITHEAPIAGRISIIGSSELWIAGGAPGNRLYRSDDLGLAWEEVHLPLADSESYGLDAPSGTDATRREAVATINGDSSTVVLLASDNAGLDWSILHEVDLKASTAPGVSLDAQFVEGSWRLVTPDGTLVTLSGDSATSVQTVGLPGVARAYFSGHGGLGWAIVSVAECPSKDDCDASDVFVSTKDSGQTWTESQLDLPR